MMEIQYSFKYHLFRIFKILKSYQSAYTIYIEPENWLKLTRDSEKMIFSYFLYWKMLRLYQIIYELTIKIEFKPINYITKTCTYATIL